MTSSPRGSSRRVKGACVIVAGMLVAAVAAPVPASAHHKPFSATINDVAANEGDAGTTPLNFTITIAPVPTEALTFTYQTSNGSAVAGTDYTATTGSVTFAAGQSAKTVTVLAHGDVEFEADETFNVDLSGPGKRVHITDSRGTGTILNEDLPPSFSVSDIEITEGDSGASNAVFDVTLDRPVPSAVTVNYATTGVSATGGGTPAPGVDFDDTSGTLSFAAGDVSEPVAVPILGDRTDEPDETLRLDLASNSAGTGINDGTGVGTIADNDPEPTVSVTDAVANEPADASSANSAVFTVSLSAVSEKTVRVDYSTADLNPPEAVAGSDYSAISGTLSFAPGEDTKDVAVPIAYDGIDPSDPEGPEGFERFNLEISTPGDANASVSDARGLGTITEETIPKLYVSDASIGEGDSGQRMATISLTLSAPTPGAVSGTFETTDAGATGAEEGEDYVSASGAAFSFDGSSRRRTTIEVAVKGDTLDEDSEVLQVVVSSPDVEMGEDTGTVTILDDDAPPIVSIGDVRVTEGNAGPTNVNFSIGLSVASGRSIVVEYTTADGSAESPADYEADSGQVVVGAGETSRPVAIRIEGDTRDEPDTESFFVDITPEAGRATQGDVRGTGTVVDDDKTPTTTTLRVTKGRRITARGLVAPALPGRAMVVKLFRKKAGRWVRVATRRPSLSAAKDVNGDGQSESIYKTKFRKPRRGRACKVVSRYRGDGNHFGSKATNRFRCRS